MVDMKRKQWILFTLHIGSQKIQMSWRPPSTCALRTKYCLVLRKLNNRFKILCRTLNFTPFHPLFCVRGLHIVNIPLVLLLYTLKSKMPATKGLLFKRYIRIELNLWRRTLFEIITMLIMVLVILLNPIAHSRRLLYTSHEHENEQSIVSHKLQDINILT